MLFDFMPALLFRFLLSVVRLWVSGFCPLVERSQSLPLLLLSFDYKCFFLVSGVLVLDGFSLLFK